ncbi:MAG: hypothetical protein AB8G96_17015 [Phycisphaerales bacterium]
MRRLIDGPLALVAAALATGVAGAATTSPFGDSYSMPAFAGTGPQIYGTMVSGRFNDDLTVDVVICRPGDRPVLAVGPERHAAQMRYPNGSQTSDVTTIPAGGGRKDLVTADATTGLFAWQRDTSNGTFVGRGLGTAASWTNVARLASGRLLGGAKWDVVGFRTSPQSLVVLQDAEGPGEQEFSFAVPRAVQEIRPFIHDATGTRRLACLTSMGVLVYSLDATAATGTLEQFIPGPDGGTLAVAARGDATYENLVWIQPGTTDDQLVVLDNDGTGLTAQAADDLGDSGIATAAADDLDGDGWGDLVLGRTSSAGVRIMLGASGVYDPSDVTTNFDADCGTADASSNGATAAIVDVDGDGDLDITYAADGDGQLYVIENRDIDAALQMPKRTSVVYGWSISEPSYLRMAYDLGDVHAPADATHIEVLVWRQGSTGAWPSTEPDRYLLATDAEIDEITIDFDETGRELNAMYFYSVRYVEIDPAGNPGLRPDQCFPSSLHAFTSEDSDDAGVLVSWLESHPYAIESSDVFVDGSGFPLPEDTTTDVDVKPLPDFDDDDEPGTGTGG